MSRCRGRAIRRLAGPTPVVSAGKLDDLPQKADEVLDAARCEGLQEQRLALDAAEHVLRSGRNDADLTGGEPYGVGPDRDVHRAAEHHHRLLLVRMLVERRLARMHQPDPIDAALEARHRAAEIVGQHLDLWKVIPFR